MQSIFSLINTPVSVKLNKKERRLTFKFNLNSVDLEGSQNQKRQTIYQVFTSGSTNKSINVERNVRSEGCFYFTVFFKL